MIMDNTKVDDSTFISNRIGYINQTCQYYNVSSTCFVITWNNGTDVFMKIYNINASNVFGEIKVNVNYNSLV